jgi:hypothetical protein
MYCRKYIINNSSLSTFARMMVTFVTYLSMTLDINSAPFSSLGGSRKPDALTCSRTPSRLASNWYGLQTNRLWIATLVQTSVQHTLIRNVSFALLLHSFRADACLSRAESATKTGLDQSTMPRGEWDFRKSDRAKKPDVNSPPPNARTLVQHGTHATGATSARCCPAGLIHGRMDTSRQ